MKYSLTIVGVEADKDEVLVQVAGDGVRGVLLFPQGTTFRAGELLALESPQPAARDLRSRIPAAVRTEPPPAAAAAAEDKGGEASKVLQAMLFGGAAPMIERNVDAEMDAFLGQPRR